MSWSSDNNHVCAFLFWGFQRWSRMVHHKPWAAVGEQKVQCSHQVGKNDIILGYAYWASVSFGFWHLKEEGRSFKDCILGHSQLLIFFKYMCVYVTVYARVWVYVRLWVSLCTCICGGHRVMWETSTSTLHLDFEAESLNCTTQFANLTLCLGCLLQGTTGSIIRALEI